MKKILTISILTIIILMFSFSVVNAVTESELKNYIEQGFTINNEKIQLTASQKVQLEKFLNEREITDQQATSIKSYIEEAKAILENANTNVLKDLTENQKQELLAKANSAANVLNLSVSYDSSSNAVVIYDGNKKIDAISLTNTKFVQTGSSNYICVIISVVAIIAVAVTFVVKNDKK